MLTPRISRAAALAARAAALRDWLPGWARSKAAARSAAVILAIAAVNLTAHTVGWSAKVVVPTGALLLGALAYGSGLRARSLGLHRDNVRHGLRLALWCIVGIAAVLTAAVLIPQTAQFFRDNRYGSLSDVALAAFILIPLTTVLPEELAFRGVLHGALSEHLGTHGSYIVGALAFGAWHVLTSGGLASGNAGLTSVVGQGVLAQVASIGGVVVATSAAGLVFIWLRRKTGSLLAPIGLHWAINALAAIATRIATHPPF